MKKLTALFLGIALVFSLAACSDSNPSGTSDPASSAPVGSAAAAGESSAPGAQGTPEAGTGKTLVVYYSATGNTEEAANYIAEATGGDLFELVPADPYTDADLNWTDENSRVVREHENPDERDVALTADTVDNWDSYDTVFIGYPKMEQGYICV